MRLETPDDGSASARDRRAPGVLSAASCCTRVTRPRIAHGGSGAGSEEGEAYNAISIGRAERERDVIKKKRGNKM